MASCSHEQVGYGAVDHDGTSPTRIIDPFDHNKEKRKEADTKLKEKQYQQQRQHQTLRYCDDRPCFWKYHPSRFCSLPVLFSSFLALSVMLFTDFARPPSDDLSVDRSDDGHGSATHQSLFIGEAEVGDGIVFEDLSKYTRKSRMSARRFSSFVQRTAITTNSNSTANPNSLSKRLFEANLDLAHQAYQTHYLQNLSAGTLDPNFYGQYSIEDIAYCAVGLQDWKHVRDRDAVAEPTTPTSAVDNDNVRSTIHHFAAERVRSWESYVTTTYADWHIADPAQSIILSDAARRYVEFERKVCHEYHPVYAAVVMAPCDRLWYWLANEMIRRLGDSGNGNDGKSNVYWGWIEENASYEDGALELERFIDANEDMIDEDLAMRVYRTAMMGEVNFFRSAGRQPPLPTTLL